MKRQVKILISGVIVIFILMNVVAFFHAYKFTHFAQNENPKTGDPDQLSMLEKGQIVLFGVDNPKPQNDEVPDIPYEEITIPASSNISAWMIDCNKSKGTVLLCHGYGGDKSKMIDKAYIFHDLGYRTLLIDFMGSGASEGNQTTIGFYEAEQVKACYDFLKKKNEAHIYLFGTSMGAVAIMKAVYEDHLEPDGLLLECPFGSMYKTVCARFQMMKLPTFPMAGLLVFWGGIQNGYWAFGHNPIKYAQGISCPTILLYGAQDQKVSGEEINAIFKDLKGDKYLRIYEKAGHENYLLQYRKKWIRDVAEFLEK